MSKSKYPTYLLDRTRNPNSETLAAYEKAGGWSMWQQVLKEKKFTPPQITEVVKASGLRGRGGAGFSTGIKWTFMPKPEDPRPRYLAINADESEPGTCKDRVLIEQDPHGIVEGAALSAFAIQARAVYCFIRGEYSLGAKVLQKAVDDAYAKGYLGKNILGSGYDLDWVVHRGAGAYICGEETALMEALEGKRGHPRPKPPFPAAFGLWGQPTTVNNVETVFNVPFILAKGADWHKSMGTTASPGNTLFGVSGHVKQPGVYEAPLGVTVKELIYDPAFGGGIRGGKQLKAFMPGGASSGFLPPSMVDVKMTHDDLKNAGTMLGTGGVVVFDETTSIIRAARVIADFFHDESCGQCSQCREGTGWLARILRRIELGYGTKADLDTLLSACGLMKGKTICVFSDAAAWPVELVLKHFRGEFEEAIAKARPLPSVEERRKLMGAGH